MKILSKMSTILFLLLTIQNGFAKENLDQQKAKLLLDKIRHNLISLSADFVQYEIDINNNKSEESTGKVWLKQPNQFKWEYQKPVQQLITADGKKVWIYDEDLEQVTIKNQENKQNPIYVLLNKELTEKNYTATLIPQSQGKKEKIQWITLVPKAISDDVKIVWIGVLKSNLTILKLQNQLDMTVVFNFKHIKRNPKLNDGFFTFKVPKGVDVIRSSAQIGEF